MVAFEFWHVIGRRYSLYLHCVRKHILPVFLQSFTSDNGGGKCDSPRCLFVCLLARLLKNACMDVDDILHVDRCRDVDELINF